MQISSINNYNQNFQARIKIQKPQNIKAIATGASLITAGAASVVTGLDASNTIQSSGLTEDLYRSINNVHEVATPNGNIEVNNESSAKLFGTVAYSSFPIGFLNTSIGIHKLSNNNSNKNNKSIPS